MVILSAQYDLRLFRTFVLELDWAARKISPGMPGCFLKAYEEADGKRLYYKLSNYDSYRGVFGHECVNELIVSRVMDVLEYRMWRTDWFMHWL